MKPPIKHNVIAVLLALAVGLGMYGLNQHAGSEMDRRTEARIHGPTLTEARTGLRATPVAQPRP